MGNEKRFRVDFQRYDAEFFEKAYEDSENFKKIPKKKERIENHKDEKPVEMYILPGALYELPYAAFDEVCRAPDMKEQTYEKFHPMLFYGYYHISEENSSTVRWFLGTSKLNTVNWKNKYIEQEGVRGFVFKLESNSVSDHIKNRRYPLSDTFFLIHPQALFIYKFGNSPNDLSYRGNIGQSRLETVRTRFIEIETELQKRELL